MKPTNQTFEHVSNLWNDKEVAGLDEVAKLIYRSNKLGADQRNTNTCGGNTSSKVTEIDPLTGAKVEVLWVKGSGGDLRTSTKESFSSLYQKKLMGLQKLYAKRKGKGLKSQAEDDMVAMYSHATFNLNPRAPSIDTPLHSFIPVKHVDHLHPNAVIAVAASANCRKLTKKIFGGAMEYVGWMRPGFELGLAMQEICKRNRKARAIMMGQHGFISWADDQRECYFRTLGFIEKAAQFVETRYAENGGDATAFGGAKYESLPPVKRHEIFASILPWLRGQVSQKKRMVATIQDDAKILRFVNSREAKRLAGLGTSCPDHFLRTKIKPLLVAWNPQKEDVARLREKLAKGLAQYRKDYAAYYQKCRRADSPDMRDPNPTVVLIPGCGMIAWGKDKSESRMTAEFYNCAVEVMRGAEAIDKYIALPQQEAFDIEYWLMEEAKLKRQPAEKELARQVIIVIGAGSGIGKELANRIAREGAQVVCVDMNLEWARAAAKEITDKLGTGIGLAGSGISNCGPAIGLACNITDRRSVREMLVETVLAYGGFDSIVVTAGIFASPDTTGHVPDDKWAVTFAVNVSGAYIVGDEAAKIWREQGLTGNLVLTTSANAVVSKKGSVAYDKSKAASNHLVRELAVDLAPLARVNGVAPATVVQGSAITPADVAEAIYLLLTKRLSKTTGQVIAVDGELREAFLRQLKSKML